MTIQELAKKLGVSKQAVYQRCKRNGIDVNTLTVETQDGRGELTEDGVNTIVNIYGSGSKQSTGVNLLDNTTLTSTLTNENETLKTKVQELSTLTEEQGRRILELDRIREKQKGEMSILRTDQEHLRRRAEEAEGRIRTAEDQLSRQKAEAEERISEQKKLYEERIRTAEDQLRRQEEQEKEYRRTAEEQIRQANERIKEAHIIAVTAQRELTASRESKGLLGWLRRLGSGKKQENGGGAEE